MNLRLIFFVCFSVFLGVVAVQFCARSPLVYQGKFQWKKTIIVRNLEGYTEGSVFESVADGLREIFKLEKGDECYYLQGEQWIWRDKKDPSFSLIPIFCPQKGGGWAMPPVD